MNPKIAFFLILSILVVGTHLLPVNLPMVNAEVSAYPPQIGEFETSSDYVVPDKIFSLRCIVSDQNGKETIQNATVELSSGAVFLWENKTDKFSLIQNQNNYARLESGDFREIENSTAYRLFFNLSYRVNMTSGPVSVLATVFDNSTLCGFGNYTSLFTFGPEPEAWQHNPSNIPQAGDTIGFEESVVILIISLVIIAVISLFSKREKSTKEKYHEMIDVKPKRREK